MGWLHDKAPGHEGYSAALHRTAVHPQDAKGDEYRELAYPADDNTAPAVHAVQPACDCGWRGDRIPVPAGHVTWRPFVADLPPELEAKVAAAWEWHAVGRASAGAAPPTPARPRVPAELNLRNAALTMTLGRRQAREFVNAVTACLAADDEEVTLELSIISDSEEGDEMALSVMFDDEGCHTSVPVRDLKVEVIG